MAFTIHDYDRILKECILSHSKWVLVKDEHGDVQIKDVFTLESETIYIDVENDNWVLYRLHLQDDDEFIARFETLKLAEKEIKKHA